LLIYEIIENRFYSKPYPANHPTRVNHKFEEHEENRTHRVSSSKRLPNSGGI